MKKFVLLILFATKVYSAEFGYESCGLEEAEQKRCEIKIVNGKKEGKEICRALDNFDVILLEAQYSNGKLNGPFICRDFLSQVYLQTSYVDGKIHGQHKDYSKSRYWKNIKEAWMIRYFEKGVQIGMEFYADKNDKILDIVGNCWEQGEIGSNYSFCLSLDYGKFNSTIKDYLRKEISKRFKELNRDIVNKFDNGKIKFKVKMVDGQYDGEAVWFFESGKIKTKTLFKKGTAEKSEDFFESARIKIVKLFKGGRLEKSEQYYENGKLNELVKVSYNGNVRRETVERFDDRGFRESEMTQVYQAYDYWGRLDGPYRIYNSEGVMVYEATFKMGNVDGKVKINYPSQKEEEFWENGVRKYMIRKNYQTGKPIEKIEYMNDGSEKSRTPLSKEVI